MAWNDFLFGIRPTSTPKTTKRLRWSTYRGDEWWCGEAFAMCGCLDFTIESFGPFTAPNLAIELIRDAWERFSGYSIYIWLDPITEGVVRTLNEQAMIVSREIELAPRTRVARVVSISGGDSKTTPTEKLPNRP